MKIGMFTDTFYPCINGVSASSLYYAKELAKMGHHIYIFCPRYRGRKGGEDVVTDFPESLFCGVLPSPPPPIRNTQSRSRDWDSEYP